MSTAIWLDDKNGINQSLNGFRVQNLKTTFWSRWWCCFYSVNENWCLHWQRNKPRGCYLAIRLHSKLSCVCFGHSKKNCEMNSKKGKGTSLLDVRKSKSGTSTLAQVRCYFDILFWGVRNSCLNDCFMNYKS